MPTVTPVSLDDIRAAHARIRGLAVRTPLVRFNLDEAPAEIYLKLENLQPVGSFKVRGAGNAIRAADPPTLADGVYTASAGNMAQGLAFAARDAGVPCSVIVPEHAPETKLAAIERFGARIVKVPFDEWWQVIVTHRFDGLPGRMIHPVSNAAVIAGNGTIGLELVEDLPDMNAVIIPYGGGGLSSGIATAVRALKPDTKIFAAEVETAAPLAASLAAGEPREVDYTPSFVDGIGGKSVLAEMWPLVPIADRRLAHCLTHRGRRCDPAARDTKSRDRRRRGGRVGRGGDDRQGGARQGRLRHLRWKYRRREACRDSQ